MNGDHEARVAELECEVYELRMWRSTMEGEVATLRRALEEARNEVQRTTQWMNHMRNEVASHEDRLRRLGSNW